jgi:hypothetical protein
MWSQTQATCQIEGESSVLYGSVGKFADVPQSELVGVGIGIGDGKSNCIPIAARGQLRTGGGVPEIAEFADLRIGRG